MWNIARFLCKKRFLFSQVWVTGVENGERRWQPQMTTHGGKTSWIYVRTRYRTPCSVLTSATTKSHLLNATNFQEATLSTCGMIGFPFSAPSHHSHICHVPLQLRYRHKWLLAHRKAQCRRLYPLPISTSHSQWIVGTCNIVDVVIKRFVHNVNVLYNTVVM